MRLIGRKTFGMGQTFNPTPAQQSLLNQIKQNESGGNYNATVSQAHCDAMMGAPNSVCTASGAYMFINETWRETAAATGVGTNCPTASSCSGSASPAA